MAAPENSQPIILSQSHVSKALADQRYFSLMPEFAVLQVKLQAMHVDLTAKRGCSSCRKQRAASSLFNDFVSIVLALSPDGLQRLKGYLGVEKIMVNTIDRATGAATLRVL